MSCVWPPLIYLYTHDNDDRKVCIAVMNELISLLLFPVKYEHVSYDDSIRCRPQLGAKVMLSTDTDFRRPCTSPGAAKISGRSLMAALCRMGISGIGYESTTNDFTIGV